jgi:hypothetical protein
VGLTASKVKVETPLPPELGKESVNVWWLRFFYQVSAIVRLFPFKSLNK